MTYRERKYIFTTDGKDLKVMCFKHQQGHKVPQNSYLQRVAPAYSCLQNLQQINQINE